MDFAELNSIRTAAEHLNDICRGNDCEKCPLRFSGGQKIKINGKEHFCFSNALNELVKGEGSNG